MLLVIDTNILVGECLRQRGRERLDNPLLELLITERADGEFRYEFARRLEFVAERSKLSLEIRQGLEDDALELYARKIFVAPAAQYEHLEAQARLRIPADPDDWPTAALALAIDAGIWTEDKHFFGCGLSVWRTDILYGVVGEG
ncbi:PIN domain-containing protein [Deinococcus saxicola]|uniref:PIN domain-containing protein n=1 Tax=Deinococcus saxicola TaxID=249406 RepID=UPI0039EE7CDB